MSPNAIHILSIAILIGNWILTRYLARKKIEKLIAKHNLEIQAVFSSAFQSGWNEGTAHGAGQERLRRALNNKDALED